MNYFANALKNKSGPIHFLISTRCEKLTDVEMVKCSYTANTTQLDYISKSIYPIKNLFAIKKSYAFRSTANAQHHSADQLF